VLWQVLLRRNGRRYSMRYSMTANDENFEAAAGFIGRRGVVIGNLTNQIALYQKPETQSEFELYQFLVRARDDAALIAQLAVTMESAINAETSAIHENSRKSIEYQKLTNKLQEETLKKPSLQVVSG